MSRCPRARRRSWCLQTSRGRQRRPRQRRAQQTHLGHVTRADGIGRGGALAPEAGAVSASPARPHPALIRESAVRAPPSLRTHHRRSRAYVLAYTAGASRPRRASRARTVCGAGTPMFRQGAPSPRLDPGPGPVGSQGLSPPPWKTAPASQIRSTAFRRPPRACARRAGLERALCVQGVDVRTPRRAHRAPDVQTGWLRLLACETRPDPGRGTRDAG